MKCPPRTHQLFALREQRFTWLACLAELIDNALDAGAQEIEFGWTTRQAFFIRDDGHGIPAAHMERLFTLGDHVPSAKVARRSGQFGIGFKHAVGWLWGNTTVVTRHAGLAGTVHVNWDQWAKSNDWDLPDPTIRPDHTGTGLEIRCERIERNAPTNEQLGALTRDASFLFNPALRRGARIVCSMRGTKNRWTAMEAPPRTDIIDRELVVHGKRLRVNVGIVPTEHSNPRSGLHYYRAHRLIKAMSTLGCGRANPARIFGWVELDRAWRISIHKDDIVDPAVDAMAAAIEEAIHEVLEKAGKMAEILAIRDIETELSARLAGALGDGVGEPTRAKVQLPTDEDQPPRKRQKREKPPTERLRDQIKRGGIRVLFGEYEPTFGIGYVEAHPLTIRLNQNHPQVARILQQKQHHLQLGGAHQLAVSLLAHYVASDERGQRLLPFMSTPLEHAYSVVLGNFLGILQNE